MKPCRECGNDCAESAKQCPKCGAERPTESLEELLKRAKKKNKKKKLSDAGISINVVKSKGRGLWWKIPIGLFLFVVLVMGVLSLTTDDFSFSEALSIAFIVSVFGIPLVLFFTFIGLPIFIIFVAVLIVAFIVYILFFGLELAQFALITSYLSGLE